MIKHIKHTMIAAAAIAVASTLAGCDEIGENDRYIQKPAIETKRVVLVEEFTGQKCTNCPDAQIVLNKMLNQYPENLIVVSIHCGGEKLSYSEEQLGGKLGLCNTVGQAYYEENKISGLPSAIINRTSGEKTPDLWPSEIEKVLKVPSHLDMTLQAYRSNDGNTIEIKTGITPYENIIGQLQLWVLESGVISLQHFETKTDTKYEHNHVFRGTVNGHDGEAVHLTVNEPQEYSHKIAVKDYWNIDNLSIVAFVYTKDGVEQAIEAHVTLPAEE